MIKSELAQLGRKIPSFLLFLLLASVLAVSLHDEVGVVDSVAEVVIHTDCGPITVMAKIDTGADGSSVDATFAEQFCITEPYIGNTKNQRCPNRQVLVRNECRKRVVFSFSIGNTMIEDRATLSDRSERRYPVLIGNRATQNNFLVRPVYETTTENWSIEDYPLDSETEE